MTNSSGIGNHVVVLPTPETVSRITETISSSPFTWDDPSSWHVTLVRNQDLAASEFVLSDSIKEATAVKASYWYDEVAGKTKFVLFLSSPALVMRHLQLGGLLPFQPHLVLAHSIPPLSQSIKAFVNSVKDTLVLQERFFSFQEELILDHQMNVKTFEDLPEI